MSSPYGPDVLPQGRRGFGDVLGNLASGFEYGRRLRELWNERGRAEEERAFAIRRREEADLAQPGAMSIGAYLGSPDAKRGLSARTIDLVGRGRIPERLEFSPEDAGDHRQTATGAVVSRRLAAEQSIAPDLERLAARASYLTPAQQEAARRADEAGTARKFIQGQRAITLERIRRENPALYGNLGDDDAIRRWTADVAADRAVEHRPGRSTRSPSAETAQQANARRLAALARRQVLDLAVDPRSVPVSRDTVGAEANPAREAQAADHEQWLAEFEPLVAKSNSADAAYERTLRGSDAVPAPVVPARTPRGAKTGQQWIDEVTADPRFATSPDSVIRAEARRRRAAAPPRR